MKILVQKSCKRLKKNYKISKEFKKELKENFKASYLQNSKTDDQKRNSLIQFNIPEFFGKHLKKLIKDYEKMHRVVFNDFYSSQICGKSKAEIALGNVWDSCPKYFNIRLHEINFIIKGYITYRGSQKSGNLLRNRSKIFNDNKSLRRRFTKKKPMAIKDLAALRKGKTNKDHREDDDSNSQDSSSHDSSSQVSGSHDSGSEDKNES